MWPCRLDHIINTHAFMVELIKYVQFYRKSTQIAEIPIDLH